MRDEALGSGSRAVESVHTDSSVAVVESIDGAGSVGEHLGRGVRSGQGISGSAQRHLADNAHPVVGRHAVGDPDSTDAFSATEATGQNSMPAARI